MYNGQYNGGSGHDPNHDGDIHIHIHPDDLSVPGGHHYGLSPQDLYRQQQADEVRELMILRAMEDGTYPESQPTTSGDVKFLMIVGAVLLAALSLLTFLGNNGLLG